MGSKVGAHGDETALKRLGELCTAAAREYGDDLVSATASVSAALARLDPAEKSQIEDTLERVLAWRDYPSFPGSPN